jgi:hypothetical protein
MPAEPRHRVGVWRTKEIVMKQYLLSVHYVEGQEPPAPETMATMYADVDSFNKQLQADGLWVFGGGLHEPDLATVVRNENGEVLTTDGPFAEAKEHIGGFWVIKAADLDAAIALAGRASAACQGPVEVRPFQEEPAA